MESLQTDYAKTSIGWQKRNLMIVNKDSQLVPFRHNRAQLILEAAKERQRKAGYFTRIIICKARQKGLSTGEAASTFEDINRNPNKHACLVSMDVDGTEKVFRMTQTFQENMPDDVRVLTKKDNRKQLVYASPHKSSILCQTAGKDVLGRGGTTHRGHYTEVAFWSNAERQLGALLAEVPKTLDSSVVIESTAFGTVGAFHDRYKSAIDRVNSGDFSGFIPLFVPWFIDDEYTMRVPSEYDMSLYDDHEAFGDEKRLVSVHGLTLEQLYWRRWMIMNDFDNDLSWFNQEYPATWQDAFQGTGRQVFRPADVDKLESQCKKPIATVEFYRDSDSSQVKYRHVNRHSNCWSVWVWPHSNHDYCGFADVAEGMLADQTNKKSDPDRSVAAIMDRRSGTVPITYYGRPDTLEFGEQFWLACQYYNWAWASPEMNSIGQSVLDAGKRVEYPHIYSREVKEDTYARLDHKEKLGWKTTQATRKPMIADLEAVVKDTGLIIYDKRFIDEFRVFVTNKAGKEVAEVGEHDDCVIAIAGLIQMHQRCPMGADFSWLEEQPERRESISFMGESGDDDDGEDDLMYDDEVEDLSEFVAN